MELPEHVDEADRERIEVAFRLLADGPMPVDELLPLLIAADRSNLPDDDGSDTDEFDEWILEGVTDSDLFWLVDPVDPGDPRLIARIDMMVEDRIFTTRLTDDDLATGSIELGPDLIAIDWPISHGDVVTVNEAPAERRFDIATGRLDLLVQSGLLDGYSSGDLIALSWQGGTIRVNPVAELGDGEPEAAALAEYGNSLDEGIGFEAYQPVLDQLALDADAYRRPIPPLTELLASRGFERDGDWFGRAGNEWEPPGKAAARQKRERIAEMLDFDQRCFMFFDAVVAAYYEHSGMLFRRRRIEEGADLPDVPFDVDYRAVVNALAYETVADGFYLWIEDHGAETHLIDFLQTLAATQRATAAAAHYLLGRVYDDAGDFENATRAYQAALAADADYRIPLYHLGWIEFDRGDFELARRHHRSAGFPAGHQLFEHYPEQNSPVIAPVGRNDPCPCGSGRKYKVCHQRNGGPAASSLTSWQHLLIKLMRYSIEVDRLQGVLILAMAATDADLDRTREMVSDPFIVDLSFFEGGMLDEFIDARGALLPSDELVIADAVRATRRDLLEIVAVEPGVSITVRSVTVGGETEVLEQQASQDLHTGDYLLGRIVPDPPDADGPGFYGHMQLVPMRGTASLLEVLDDTNYGGYDGGDAIADWYGALTGPPTLTTREGEPLEAWIADLRIDAAVASVIELVETFAERDDDRWHEFFELRSGASHDAAADDVADSPALGRERILRATIFIEDFDPEHDGSGTSVMIEAMALARVERVLKRLRDAFEVEVLSLEAAEPPTLDDDPIGMVATDIDDDQRAILESYMLDYERQWLNESIPALGGLTPRQAFEDPTRRDDLVRLLNSMPPVPEGALGMDADRLRAALGLD